MATQDDNNDKEVHKGTKVPYGGLTPDEVEYIIATAAKRAADLAVEPAAKRAKELAIEDIQKDVGRGTIRAAYWAGSAVILGLLGWLGSKGLVKP